MRLIHTSAAVRDLVGAEQLARLSTPELAARVQCWECECWVEPAEPVTLLAIQPTDAGGLVTVTAWAHPRCAASQVLQVDPQELEARRLVRDLLAGDEHQDQAEADVVALATVTEVGTGGVVPVVLFSFTADVSTPSESGDRVDALASYLLSAGWQLATGTDHDLANLPAGWRLRFTHQRPERTAPGRLLLTEASGAVMADLTAYVPGEYWRPGVLLAGGRCRMYAGARFLPESGPVDQARLAAAFRAGSIVGGTVTVELDGPGNTLPPRPAGGRR